MQLNRWNVGVTVAGRSQRTLDRTLTSLREAGFPQPRIFADGDVEIPREGPLTRRLPAIGGWPNFWLALTELVARDPQADAYLLVQDDVVFCRRTLDYVRLLEIPKNCGVLSLFCPACYNGPSGWHPVECGYGFAGAQALAFARDQAFQFLASPWTVNHRRASPRSEHYRGDGLHHIDGVVGEWCRRAKLRVYTHSPSLSEHVGHASVMYPGFKGKQERRFSDTFPGEDFDALQEFSHFFRNRREWLRLGGDQEYTLSAPLWAAIVPHLKPGLKTLEMGSGLSTKLFLDARCDHTSLEHDATHAGRLCSAAPACLNAVRICRLAGDPLWYDWAPPHPFDLILVDGPPGEIGRTGVLRVLDQCVHDDTMIFLDDTGRPDEAKLAEQMQERLQWGSRRSTAGHYGYTILARKFN